MKKLLLPLSIVMLLSGCGTTTGVTTSEPIIMTDQQIEDVNDAALCSLSKTNPDQRIDIEMQSRNVDCKPAALRCGAKGIKKGTKKFSECKKRERSRLEAKNNALISLKQVSQKQPSRRLQQACGRITVWLERMECFEKALSSDKEAKEATFGREVLSYMRVLIENVKSGKRSEAEAKYAYEQKLSEIRQRLSEREALESLSRLTNQMQRPQVLQSAPTYQGSVRTECRPARGLEGGFDCTTGPDDMLLQKLSNPLGSYK